MPLAYYHKNNRHHRSLNMTSAGDVLQMVTIRGGWGIQRRLADLGLTPGVQLRVINNQRPGPVVIEVRGSRLALGRSVAHHIMIEPL